MGTTKTARINYDKLMTPEVREHIEIYLESMLAIGADINEIVLRLSVPVIKRNLALLIKNGAKLESSNFAPESAKRRSAREQELLGLLEAGATAYELYWTHRVRSADDVRFLIDNGMSTHDFLEALPSGQGQLEIYMENWLDHPEGIDFQKLACMVNPRAMLAYAYRLREFLPDYDFDDLVMHASRFDATRFMERLMLAGITPSVLVERISMDAVVPNFRKLLDYGALPEQLLDRLSSKAIALNYRRLNKLGVPHEQLFARLEPQDLADRQEKIQKAGAPDELVRAKLAGS